MKKINKKKRYLFLIAALVFILWTIWGNTALETTEISIMWEDFPAAFDGYRIAQISDLHNASFGADNERLLALLREQQPDMIAMTGDLVDSVHTDIETAAAFARRAAEIAPCYFVTGNHEARLGEQYAQLEQQLKEAGVTVLRNQVIRLERDGAAIQLIGLDDPRFTEQDEELSDSLAYFNEVLSSMELTDEYRILLSHRPEAFEAYVNHRIDLAFTGHAHGGQFRLPFLGGLIAPNQGLFPRYDDGLYEEGRTCMLVSRGLGNSVIPFRINNRPEVIVVELHGNGN